MRNSVRHLIGALVVALSMLVLAGCAQTRSLQHSTTAGGYAQTAAVTRQTLDLLLADGSITSASVAVMHEGKVVFSQGFGFRDKTLSLPVDESTRFNIGSISKVFTTAAVLMLVQEGRLSLDEPVAEVLEGFSMADERYRSVTVRMLLNHTSGFPGTNFHNGFASESIDGYVQETLRVLSESMLKHDPGAHAVYCNDGFTVAQALVEQLSGVPFAEFMHERIFKPLGMDHTGFGFGSGSNDYAKAYGADGKPLPPETVNIQGSGGLSSTPLDVLKFASATYGAGLLNDGMLDEFLSAQPGYADEIVSFRRQLETGLGWDMTVRDPYRMEGVQVVGKSGGTFHYTSMLFVVPDTGTAVALMCSGNVDQIEVADKILRAGLTETGQFSGRAYDDRDETPEQPLPLLHEMYAGWYGSRDGLSQIEFDAATRSMTLSDYDGVGFQERISATHVGDGMYVDGEGQRYSFSEMAGIKVLLGHAGPTDRAEVLMTRLESHDSGSGGSRFPESVWLMENLATSDFYHQVFATEVFDQVGRHVLLYQGAWIPYGEMDGGRTRMVLPMTRDQIPPRLVDGRLVAGGYRCISIDDVSPLRSGEPVEAGGETSSVWRKIGPYGTFRCEVPADCRVIALGYDFSTREDTLFTNAHLVEVTGAAYVAFIADEPHMFQPSFTEVSL